MNPIKANKYNYNFQTTVFQINSSVVYTIDELYVLLSTNCFTIYNSLIALYQTQSLPELREHNMVKLVTWYKPIQNFTSQQKF